MTNTQVSMSSDVMRKHKRAHENKMGNMSLINKKTSLTSLCMEDGKMGLQKFRERKGLHVNNVTKSVAVILKQDR